MLFSQRMGIKPPKKEIQIDSMDNDLRNSLWNALIIFFWDEIKAYWNKPYTYEYKHIFERFIKKLWFNYFKKPLDTLSYEWPEIYGILRNYFFKCPWNEVYDFIEFIANNYPNETVSQKFTEFCNSILERESSAYRFVNGKILQITSKLEISEIEEAIEKAEKLPGVRTHLRRALELLTDRKNPDYRNSIKESILAVESICKKITDDEKATLGKALKEIENKNGLHPALKGAFSKLYGYTSDAEGIRHALLEESTVDFEEAKFMLVSCSAFINYLISKAEKLEII